MTDEKLGKPSLLRYLRPDKFDIEPDVADSDTKWLHWKSTFESFLAEEITEDVPDSLKRKILVNHLSASIYKHIKTCSTYKDSMKVLEDIYVKPKNTILARHILFNRKQRADETISDYVRALRLSAKDCKFEDVTAQEHEDQAVRSALISGLLSRRIRERLLENSKLTLSEALNQAVALETAEKDAVTIGISSSQLTAISQGISRVKESENLVAALSSRTFQAAPNTPPPAKPCFFCGGSLHPRFRCPANKATCKKCSKKGHFASVCRSGNFNLNSTTVEDPTTPNNDQFYSGAISAASPSSLRSATIPIMVNEYKADALVDTGSSVSFINGKVARIMKLRKKPCQQTVNLASLNQVSFVEGVCFATITMNKHTYKQTPLLVVDNLCADVIIGHDLLKHHSSIHFNLGGPGEPLEICNVLQASVPPASVFTNLSPNIRPIVVRSRRYSKEDEDFIKEEVSKLLEDGVVETSISPWRAQVLVAGGGVHRKRLVIDYSMTINKFTELDAFPLPSIESVVSNVSRFKVFSQIDLKSAYHQVPILENEKIYTAFEACGKLYQFTRIPFGVTNGVAAFQRTLDFIITEEKLEGTFAYLDDVTVCGKDQRDHDHNLKRFLDAANKFHLTLNEQKSVFNKTKINLLGYTVENNTISPDPERLKPLLELPAPTKTSELKRVLGMLAHYAKWIARFSEKIKPLTCVTTFPLPPDALKCFEELKQDIKAVALVAINDNEMFTVETDASEFALGATLTQHGRPVAFFSRTLNNSECKQSSIEKEACAIVESLKKWRHYLIGRHFLLITDQQSVAFMFNQNHNSKIKNEKIQRWRLELSCFKYDIVYRPGTENAAADALSRVCAYMNINKLKELHNALCHPGVTRMYHWVRSKNLPYSANDVKEMTASCPTCAEIKPRFFKVKGQLIKATSPFERINIDFKGPLPSETANKYILTIIDEYSRFPFAYACKDMTSATVITCLKDLFLTFGQPLYIHSDRGSSFMSEEFKSFLRQSNIASSRTTPYNPQGNGQVERLNGTLWRTIQLSLRSKGLSVENWEVVLKDALHCVRSLLCTATNATPHEKLFTYPRRSPNGDSLPSWLTPGPILVKKNIRSSKTDPLVEEAELLETNPYYSLIRRDNGETSTVSNRQLAPFPSSTDDSRDDNFETASEDDSLTFPSENNSTPPPENIAPSSSPRVEEPSTSSPVLRTGLPRKSNRARKLPTYLADFVVDGSESEN
ncbi:uncharacterized protein LOC123868459 [Maniola jurtina]|uniref:uncharacterized protein LOC123868459 n=1 Tax=Maniola jurtina TaxID=191418 RepID=UPI001E68AED4|nr:uncharacterized protein LOC123868459 [Maniola jurtina]